MTDEENKEPIKQDEQAQPTDLEANAAGDMVVKANEAADRMEAANRERARLLQKEETLKVEKTLGGKAEVTEPGKKEESPEDYAKRVLNNDL